MCDKTNNTFEIKKDDVLKSIYFICRLTQNQNGKAMSGALSSKKDYMGGIFDRWINIIPESIIFNKGILPEISNGKTVEVITDFYSYEPTANKAGIAPDVIGIRVNGKVIPFAQFNEKWIPVQDKPQIEIKTYKKADYMVSLRNQNYDEKYFVMVQSDFRLDYLIPFFDKEVLSNDIYSQLSMDDKSFVISNEKGYLSELLPVDTSSDLIGSVTLLSITTADSFMNASTCCESGVGVEWLKSIEICNKPRGKIELRPLLDICVPLEENPNIFHFTEEWYSGIGEDNIPYKSTKKRNGNIVNTKVRTLDFYTDNISNIELVRLNKSAMRVFAKEDVQFNSYSLKKGNYYLISYSCLERGNNGDEYFLQKDLVRFIKSNEEELKNKIKKIIQNELDIN